MALGQAASPKKGPAPAEDGATMLAPHDCAQSGYLEGEDEHCDVING